MMGVRPFTLQAKAGEARAGTLETGHGAVETPTFMPVGTRASVKCVSSEDLKELGAQIILGNTYHLYLRPGEELIERIAGGLHRFMSWPHPILTDSGGYQIYSLANTCKLSEKGALFQSHLDGSSHLITPEKSMEIQKKLGSDIVMAFDECPSLPNSKEALRESMNLTIKWALRCRKVPLREYQLLFGIVQGGLHLDLRVECLQRLEELNFAGLAIGGLSVGEKNEEMVEFCRDFIPLMPAHKPRYLMGVGSPLDILTAIKNGVDMFDCVLPTRNARNGQVFTRHGPFNIKKERFKEDLRPLDPHCQCRVCKNYSRAYLNHLHRTGEYLAGQLITYHNLFFYLHLTRKARQAILQGAFDEFYSSVYKSYSSCEWR